MTSGQTSILKTFTFVDPECSLKAFGKKRVFPLENGKVKALDPHTATIIFFKCILRFLEGKMTKLAKKEENREHFMQHPFQKFVMRSQLTVMFGDKTYQYACSKTRTFVTSEEFTIVREASEDIEEIATQRGITMRSPSLTQNVCDTYDLLSESQVNEKIIKCVLGYEGDDQSLKDCIMARFSNDDDPERGMTITWPIYKKRLNQVIRASLQERLIILEEENQKLKDSFRETEESNEILKEKIRSQEEAIIHLQTESVMLNIQNSVMVSSRTSTSYMDDLSTLKDITY